MAKLTINDSRITLPSKYRLIENEFLHQIGTCNIPAFRIMAKELSIENYFLNHQNYMAILGTHIGILDQMMRSSICKVEVDALLDILDNQKNGRIVGVWNNYSVYAIVAATVSTVSNDKSLEYYLTAQQFKSISDEALKTIDAQTYMAYSEFSVESFMRQLQLTENVSLSIIMKVMKESIPNLFMTTNESSVPMNLKIIYENIMIDDMKVIWGKLGDQPVVDTPASENLIKLFVDNYEKPFMTMIALMLQNTGLSQNVINMALNASKVNILYDDPTDKKIGDIGIVFTIYSPTFKDKAGKPIKADYTSTIRDMLDCAMLRHTMLPKDANEKFGKPLRTFVLTMISYVINIYIKTIESHKPEDIPTANINEDEATEHDSEYEDFKKAQDTLVNDMQK